MEEKSRTAAKHEAEALQKLGERLVALSKHQVQGLDIPDNLKEAVLFAQTIPSHGARRRQLQFIGTLMRTLDPEPVKKTLDNLSMGRIIAQNRFKRIEELRDELISSDDGAVNRFMETYPEADRQKLRQLTRNAKKELERKKPPKSARSLFRYIREILELRDC